MIQPIKTSSNKYPTNLRSIQPTKARSKKYLANQDKMIIKENG